MAEVEVKEEAEAWTICKDALGEKWKGEISPREAVDIMFAALDEVGDLTVPRDEAARDDATVMAGQVFADLGEEGVDYGALTSNVLRALGHERLTFTPRGRQAMTALPVEARAEALRRVAAHEKAFRYDCSDGPVLGMSDEAALVKSIGFSCCGWTETLFGVEGGEFIVGTCHGH